MFNLCSHIEVGSFVFTYVNGVSIDSSWKNMTDKATIKLPRNLKLQYKNLRDIITPGMEVLVKLGYNNELNEEFKGYVSAVKPTFPMEIDCEDEFYKLKRMPVAPKSWKSIELSDLLEYMCPEVKRNIIGADLGAFRIDKETNTVAKVLEAIKQSYGLYSFFRNGELTIGLQYDPASQKEAIFHFQKNIISHQLEFKRKEDVKIKVKAVSHLFNNKKIEVEIGDKDEDASTQSMDYTNLTKEQLTIQANKDLDSLKYDGYRGSFTAFGIPVVNHGDIADLRDDEYPEKNGKFSIQSVKKTFDTNGFRREIELDKKAS
jgi:hypothetical protein